MAVYRVEGLPDSALAAAARFHAHYLPQIERLAADQAAGGQMALTIVFGPADHTHGAWRLAAVQALARTLAPIRVNAVAGDDADAIGAAHAWLETAPGVTGQYWPLDAAGATCA